MFSKYNIPSLQIEQIPVRQIPDEHDLFENNVGGCQRHFYMILNERLIIMNLVEFLSRMSVVDFDIVCNPLHAVSLYFLEGISL